MTSGTIEISSMAKNFFRDCVYLLQNSQTFCIDPNTNKSVKTVEFKKLENSIWFFAVKHNEFIKKYSSEAFYLSVNSGIREAVTEELKKDITRGDPLLSGISTENEIDFLFFDLMCSYPDSRTIKIILEHICQEINEIVSEYDAISMLAYHKTQLYQDKLSEEIKDSINRTKETAFELEENVSRSIECYEEKTKKRLQNFSKVLMESEKKTHESNITILGIFSAIVLTFSTTVNFFASIINSFGGFSSYKIFLIILITGFICVGALLGLFYYLGQISENQRLKNFLKDLKTDAKHKSEKCKNSSTTATVLKKKLLLPKSILPFIIIEILLLILMGIVVIGWRFGWIEKRNSDISEKYTTFCRSSRTYELESTLSNLNIIDFD